MRMPICPHPYDLQSFVDDALDADEFARVRDHLAACEPCAARVAELERLRWLLPARMAPASDDLPERILELLETAIPVRKLRCREARATASAYIDHELNELERETLEAHLFACDTCYHQYVAMRATARAMRETPQAAASDDLKERILSAVAADAAEPEPVIGHIEPRPALPTTWRRALAPAAAIAAVALLTFGVVRVNERSEESTAPTLASATVSVAGAAALATPSGPSSAAPDAAPPDVAPADRPALPRLRPRPTQDGEPVRRETAIAERPANASASEIAHREAVREPARRSVEPAVTPAPAERSVAPGPTVVIEPRTLAMRPGTEARQPSRLTTSDRTPRRIAGRTGPAMETRMPAPPPPETPDSLIRPEPRIVAREPASSGSPTPELAETSGPRVASRGWAPRVSESRTTLYSGPSPRDVSADLAELSAAINADAAAKRETPDTDVWSPHD